MCIYEYKFLWRVWHHRQTFHVHVSHFCWQRLESWVWQTWSHSREGSIHKIPNLSVRRDPEDPYSVTSGCRPGGLSAGGTASLMANKANVAIYVCLSKLFLDLMLSEACWLWFMGKLVLHLFESFLSFTSKPVPSEFNAIFC